MSCWPKQSFLASKLLKRLFQIIWFENTKMNDNSCVTISACIHVELGQLFAVDTERNTSDLCQTTNKDKTRTGTLQFEWSPNCQQHHNMIWFILLWSLWRVCSIGSLTLHILMFCAVFRQIYTSDTPSFIMFVLFYLEYLYLRAWVQRKYLWCDAKMKW